MEYLIISLLGGIALYGLFGGRKRARNKHSDCLIDNLTYPTLRD